MTFLSCQADKGAKKTGVKGFAGRPLWPWLPTLHAAWQGGYGGDHLEEDAGRELADLPWSVDIRDLQTLEKEQANCVERGKIM